jgi:hypothetical protein
LEDNVVQKAELDDATADAVEYKAMADDMERKRDDIESMYDKALDDAVKTKEEHEDALETLEAVHKMYKRKASVSRVAKFLHDSQ